MGRAHLTTTNQSTTDRPNITTQIIDKLAATFAYAPDGLIRDRTNKTTVTVSRPITPDTVTFEYPPDTTSEHLLSTRHMTLCNGILDPSSVQDPRDLLTQFVQSMGSGSTAKHTIQTACYVVYPILGATVIADPSHRTFPDTMHIDPEWPHYITWTQMNRARLILQYAARFLHESMPEAYKQFSGRVLSGAMYECFTDLTDEPYGDESDPHNPHNKHRKR